MLNKKNFFLEKKPKKNKKKNKNKKNENFFGDLGPNLQNRSLPDVQFLESTPQFFIFALQFRNDFPICFNFFAHWFFVKWWIDFFGATKMIKNEFHRIWWATSFRQRVQSPQCLKNSHQSGVQSPQLKAKFYFGSGLGSAKSHQCFKKNFFWPYKLRSKRDYTSRECKWSLF